MNDNYLTGVLLEENTDLQNQMKNLEEDNLKLTQLLNEKYDDPKYRISAFLD